MLAFFYVLFEVPVDPAEGYWCLVQALDPRLPYHPCLTVFDSPAGATFLSLS